MFSNLPLRGMVSSIGSLVRMPTRPISSPHFFSLHHGDKLEVVLARPYSAFIEVSYKDKMDSLLEKLLIDSPDISISLTTHSCFNHHVAQVISQTISNRFNLLDEQIIKIQTCLQEAIMNSIIHANLGMDGKFKSVSSFDEYQDEINQRMESDDYKYKRININIWDGHNRLRISVEDEGSGFLMPENDNDDNVLPHGRGLMFIRMLSDRAWVADDDKTLNMLFNY